MTAQNAPMSAGEVLALLGNKADMLDAIAPAVCDRVTNLDREANELRTAQTAVAALIEREAAQAKRIAELEQIAAGHRDGRLAALEKAAALESERDALAAEVKALRQLHAAVCKNGDWDEGCFYYAGRSASELQQPLRDIEALARASAATGGGNG